MPESQVCLAPDSSAGLAWAVVAIIAVFLTLAVSILTSLIIHSRKIRESENRFRLLFDRVIDALVLFDETGKVVDANRAACKRLGYHKDEITCLSFINFQPSLESVMLKSVIDGLLRDGNELTGETFLVDKNGLRFPIEGSAARFQYRDKTYIIGSFRDITERKLAEENLKAERKSLQEKNIALKGVLDHIREEKNELKRGIADKVEKVILPTLRKTIVSRDAIDEAYYNMLVSEIKGLAGDPDTPNGSSSIMDKLSPREQEICDLIRSGATTKEIANALHISVATVNKHRERIRTRLGIAHKDINLSAYLRRPEPPPITPQ